MPGVHFTAEPPNPPSYLLTKPAPPADVIHRLTVGRDLGRIIETHRVTLVTAPAGYGKTTALSSWAATTPRPVAWLSLTRSTGTPVSRDQPSR